METTADMDRKELLAALTPLKTIVRKHTGIYIRALQCVKISHNNHTLEIVATDLETTITTTIPSASTSTSAQTGIVDYAALIKSVRAHKHERITLTIGDHQILISSPTATTTLPTADPDIWPNIPEIEHSPTPDITINSAALTTALAQTLPSAGTDSARPTLNCIKVTYAGGLTIQATDSYRAAISIISDRSLAIHSHPIPPTVIPLQIAQAIKAAIIAQGETTFQYATPEEDSTYRDIIVHIQGTTTQITTNIQTKTLCNPKFPNLRTVWDQPRNSTGKFNRQAMLAALKQVLGGNRAKDLILRLEPNAENHNLTLTIEHAGTTATATIPYEGELVGCETSIGFNPQYFLAGIEAVCSEEIVIESETSMKPIVLKSTDTATEYLLMPKRIDQ